MINRLKEPYCPNELCVSTRWELKNKSLDELYKVLNKCNKCSEKNPDNNIVQETRNTVWVKRAEEFAITRENSIKWITDR